jgi:hypothetical protein
MTIHPLSCDVFQIDVPSSIEIGIIDNVTRLDVTHPHLISHVEKM